MPMMLAELPSVEFEISILSPPERVESIQQIEIGRHGLMISKDAARGLLLPQVAATYKWNREQFLRETCRKAGLRPDDWKDGATIHSFNALVFGERERHPSSNT
jgi:uncharacterized protein (TIGR00296 family)